MRKNSQQGQSSEFNAYIWNQIFESLEDPHFVSSSRQVYRTPFHQLMLFLSIKYSKNLKNILEHDLADQISFWFYTSLLYNPKRYQDRRKRTLGTKKLTRIFQDDEELAKWYILFFKETKAFYKEALQILNLTTIFPKNIMN